MPAKAASADSWSRRLTSAIALRHIVRFLPSRRSLAIGLGIAAIAAGGYAIARETSLFAIRQLQVTGGSRAVDAQVAQALAPFVGRSLVGLDGGAVLQRTETLSTVVSATYDRAFPSTLHVTIVPERPAAVLRDGPAAWVISERDRVMRPIAVTGARTLPRIWAALKSVRAGEMLPLRQGGTITRAVIEAGSFRSRVAVAALVNGQLIFHLKSGLALVLGSPADIPLKIAVAAKVLDHLPSGTRTIDVSVPSRPLASPVSTSSGG